MVNTYQGSLQAKSFRFGIVVSRFNRFVTDQLLAGAVDALQRHGVNDESIDVFWVPGAFDIAVLARQLAKTKNYQAMICLGCVIRGATPHFDFVAKECASGIARVSSETGIPTTFGVLTTHTTEQAIERAGTKAGNKGFDAAMAAIEMANLMSEVETGT